VAAGALPNVNAAAGEGTGAAAAVAAAVASAAFSAALRSRWRFRCSFFFDRAWSALARRRATSSAEISSAAEATAVAALHEEPTAG
jgi:hypothetical protein